MCHCLLAQKLILTTSSSPLLGLHKPIAVGVSYPSQKLSPGGSVLYLMHIYLLPLANARTGARPRSFTPSTPQLDSHGPSPTVISYPDCKTKPQREERHSRMQIELPLANAPTRAPTLHFYTVNPSIGPLWTPSHHRFVPRPPNQTPAARFAHSCIPPPLRKCANGCSNLAHFPCTLLALASLHPLQFFCTYHMKLSPSDSVSYVYIYVNVYI